LRLLSRQENQIQQYRPGNKVNLFQYKNNIWPIEVKAGKTGTLKSMQMYLYEKKLHKGIRFNMDLPTMGTYNSKVNAPGKNTGLSWKLMSLPLYMVSELKRIIDLGVF
jgi:hypothetical protein